MSSKAKSRCSAPLAGGVAGGEGPGDLQRLDVGRRDLAGGRVALPAGVSAVVGPVDVRRGRRLHVRRASRKRRPEKGDAHPAKIGGCAHRETPAAADVAPQARLDVRDAKADLAARGVPGDSAARQGARACAEQRTAGPAVGDRAADDAAADRASHGADRAVAVGLVAAAAAISGDRNDRNGGDGSSSRDRRWRRSQRPSRRGQRRGPPRVSAYASVRSFSVPRR